jgi:RNA recognition motif-containing protein
VTDVNNAIEYAKGKTIKRPTVRLGKKDKLESKPITIDNIGNILDNDPRKNIYELTVIVKNLPDNITEEELKTFILLESPRFVITDIRLVKDKRGKSQNFAYIDFQTAQMAKECVRSINNKKINDKEITCAISKPPSLGENDKRTLYVNKLAPLTTEEMIRETFVQVSLFYYSMGIYWR